MFLFRILIKLLRFDVTNIATFQLRFAYWLHKRKKQEDKAFLNPDIELSTDRLGRAETAQSGEVVLRPKLLTRAVASLLFIVLCPYILSILAAEFPEVPLWGFGLVGLFACFGLLHFLTFELRYDNVRVVGRGMMFNRIEYHWDRLTKVDLVDDRTFLFNFEGDEKLQAYKSLEGVAELVAFAQRKVIENTGTISPEPEAKSAWAKFGNRKTFP